MDLTDTDCARLELFLRKLDHLHQHSLLADGGLRYTINVGVEGAGGEFADEEALESFSVRLRHFYLQHSHHNVVRLLGRYPRARAAGAC